MSSRINEVRRRFNRSAAGGYEKHALVQRNMADRLLGMLNGFASSSKEPAILEIGCGTGVLTEKLLAIWPQAKLTALDIAPAMLHAAEQRVRARSTDVQFIQADIEEWAASASLDSYDLVISNACFQWLSRPEETLGHLYRLLRSGGVLAFATFGPDTFQEMHDSFHEVYRRHQEEPQRHGLSFLTKDQWENLLQANGYAPHCSEHSFYKERFDSVKHFLYSVKSVGASASEAKVPKKIGVRRLFTEMFEVYEERYGNSDGVEATYELLLLRTEAKYEERH
jgi:malonyl-CoA O-methyltransferase